MTIETILSYMAVAWLAIVVSPGPAILLALRKVQRLACVPPWSSWAMSRGICALSDGHDGAGATNVVGAFV